MHKGGPSEEPSNYRLISILPIVSKVIEKHVTKHLLAYLNKYKLVNEVAIFFDLRTAFDVVDHEIPLQKLALYGVRGTSLR